MERIASYVQRHELDVRTIMILYEHGHLSDEFSEVGESKASTSSQGKSSASMPVKPAKDLKVSYAPEGTPPSAKPLRTAGDLSDPEEPIMVRGLSEDADAMASDGSRQSSEPRVTREKVFRVGQGKSYHAETCHHLRRIETKGNTPLFLCSCIKIRGVGRDLDLHLADDRSLHQSTKCPRYKPVLTGEGIRHHTLTACSQCF